MNKKLYKSRNDVKLDGVCGGLAEYLGVDATLVRLLWAASIIVVGSGFWLYIICAVIMPRDPGYTDTNYIDSRTPNPSTHNNNDDHPNNN